MYDSLPIVCITVCYDDVKTFLFFVFCLEKTKKKRGRKADRIWRVINATFQYVDSEAPD